MAALAISFAAAGACAQPRALTLGAGERLVLDGHLDEAAWQAAPVHERFVQFLPVDRQPPPAGYRTTVQVVAEDNALVIGVRAFDPAPQDIRAPLTRRDQVRRDQDFISVFIDAVGDRRASQFVRINAAGVIADGVYQASTDNEDFAPDFDVEAAVARLPDGYSVELRLPFIALRYPYEGGSPWRLMVARSVPRDSSMLFLSAPLNKDGLSFIAEMQVVEGLEAVADRARRQSLLLVRPELTLRGTRDRVAGVGVAREEKASLGAELKWRPRADFVLDATLNPDFSQVELDAPQLAGNTRFALSVPEKRPFFLESTDVIDLPLAGFYSRSITDPRYGLRATWRGAQADATALSLRDEGGGLVLRPGPFGTDVFAQDGSSQATLLRARRHMGSLTAGALVSERNYGERGRNSVVGADLYWALGAQDQVKARALGSRTSAGFDAQGRAVSVPGESGHWVELRWNHRTADWVANVTLDEVSPRFRNDNGFVDQAGVRRIEAELIRRWGEMPLPGFIAHEFESYLWTRQIATVDDAAAGIAGGQLVARRWHPGVWFAGPRNSEGWLQLTLDAERVRPGGVLHPVRGAGTQMGINPAPWFPRATIELNVGERVDVEADRVGQGADGFIEANLRTTIAGYGVESEQRLQHAFIDRDGRRALTDSAARWLGVLHLSARDSLRIVWQASRFLRAADAALAIAAAQQDTRTLSLVYQHRVGLSRSLSVGATRAAAEPARERRDEIFFKAAMTL
jgi:hypothetical protein